MPVVFDDEHAVANAGLVLPATLSSRLDLEAAGNRLIRLAGPGRSRPGRKALTVVHAMTAGGDCIDDVDVLRASAGADLALTGEIDVLSAPLLGRLLDAVGSDAEGELVLDAAGVGFIDHRGLMTKAVVRRVLRGSPPGSRQLRPRAGSRRRVVEPPDQRGHDCV